MRKNPDIQGYLSFIYDCAPHVIGAIDVFRDRKAMFDELAGIYTHDLVMLDCLRRNFWSGENVRADIHFSHYGGEEANDCVAKWWLEGFGIDGKISGVAVERGDVRNVGEIRFKAPAVDATRVARLYVQLMKEDKSLSKNYVEIRVYPLRYWEPRIKNINIYASSEMSGGLGGISVFTLGRLDILGYDHFDGLNPGNPVTLATTIDEPLWTYINDGGTVLLLISDELDLTNVTSKPRIHPSEGFLRQHGLLLGGDEFHHGGVTGSHFIRKVQGLFERIPFENPIGWPFYRAIPHTVLIGMKPENNADILAGGHGSFLRSQPKDSYGKRHPSEVTATIAQFRHGKGQLIISTFELLSGLADDPVATIMFNDLVAYAATNFEPKTDLLEKE